MNLSYVRKSDENSRFASLGTPGLAAQDPAAQPVSADDRRRRLLVALEVEDTGQTLKQAEKLTAAALAR